MNRMAMIEKTTVLLAAVLLLAPLVSCFGPERTPPLEKVPELKLEMGPAAPPRISLAPGDEIDVKFFYAPELNETEAVRPDGAITLQLVGDVPVQGKTPAEVREDLKKLFKPHLRNPEVAVIVRSLVDRRVYVGGAVNAPGLVQMPGRMTALEAIMAAGGFDPEAAKVENVVIIRQQNGRRYGCALDFKKALEGEIYQPFFLEPYDVVYVPETAIVKVTRWIDQHINKVIPIGFRYTVHKGDATIGLDTGGFRGGR